MGILNLEVMPVPRTAEAKRGRGRPPLSEEKKAAKAAAASITPEELAYKGEILNQALAAFRRGNRLNWLVSFILAGFVPAASYTIVHVEVTVRPMMWVLVGGGLLYSAFSVYTWGCRKFGDPRKAFGFVVLLEGILTFCRIGWLSLTGLAILMIVNAMAAVVPAEIGD
jgi:hypothetical protein